MAIQLTISNLLGPTVIQLCFIQFVENKSYSQKELKDHCSQFGMRVGNRSLSYCDLQGLRFFIEANSSNCRNAKERLKKGRRFQVKNNTLVMNSFSIFYAYIILN